MKPLGDKPKPGQDDPTNPSRARFWVVWLRPLLPSRRQRSPSASLPRSYRTVRYRLTAYTAKHDAAQTKCMNLSPVDADVPPPRHVVAIVLPRFLERSASDPKCLRGRCSRPESAADPYTTLYGLTFPEDFWPETVVGAAATEKKLQHFTVVQLPNRPTAS